MDIICQVLQAERDHAREIVEAVIDSEQNYLFTNDSDYKENRSSIVPPSQQQQEQQFDQNGMPVKNSPQQTQARGTNVFVKEIRARIDTYFRIVLRNVRDTVPKQIGYFLVKMS